MTSTSGPKRQVRGVIDPFELHTTDGAICQGKSGERRCPANASGEWLALVVASPRTDRPVCTALPPPTTPGFDRIIG